MTAAVSSSQRSSGSSSQQRLNGRVGADAAVAASPSSSSSPCFLTAIQPLHDRFTFSYTVGSTSSSVSSSQSSPPPSSPLCLFLRCERAEAERGACLVLTATDTAASQLWQLRVDEAAFNAAKRRLGIGSDGQHAEMVAMLQSAVLSSPSAQQPRVLHQQPQSLSAPLTLQLTLLVHQLRITSSWTLQPLLRQPTAAVAVTAAAAGSDGAVEDSLPFPDCDFLDEPPPRQLRQAVSSPSEAEQRRLYQAELGLFLHRLLAAFVSATATSQPSSSSALSSPSPSSAADAALLEASVRTLEARLAASEEEVERMKAVMAGAAGGAGGRRGQAADGGAAARRKEGVRKMSDRSVLNPNLKRRRQRGIRQGD